MNNALATQSAPYSQEAEEAALGSILVLERIGKIKRYLRVEDFFFLRHGYVYTAMLRIEERGDPVEYITVLNELRELGWLDEIGGAAYITYLVTATPTSIYGIVYARMVRRAADRRRTMMAADEIKALALNEEITIEEVTRWAREKLVGVDPDIGDEVVISIREAIAEQQRRVEDLQGNPIVGIPTGIKRLDDLFGGFRRNRVYGVLARTHIGKTSFMLSVLLHAAGALKPQGLITVFLSVEEAKDDLTDRLVSLSSGIPKDKISRGALDEDEMVRYLEHSNRIAELGIVLVPVMTLRPRELLDRLIEINEDARIGFVGVDYIQAMDGKPTDKDEYQKLIYISNCFPKIAKNEQLGTIPIMYGIQAKRDIEKREDKHPHLDDSEGCGKIEQRVDVMFGLYRDGFYNSDTLNPDMMDIDVLKNKVNGDLGRVYTYSDPITGRVSDATVQHVELNDDPPANVKRAEFKGNPYAGQQPSSGRGMAISGLRDGTSDREGE